MTAELIPVRIVLATPRVLGDQMWLPWFASVFWFRSVTTSCGEAVIVGDTPPLGPVVLSKS